MKNTVYYLCNIQFISLACIDPIILSRIIRVDVKIILSIVQLLSTSSTTWWNKRSINKF